MAARVVTRHYDRALAPAGVTANAFALLAALEREGPLARGSLASRLAMDRTTLSREVAPLEAAGLVRTKLDPGDRRRRELSLAGPGSELLQRARPLWAAAQAELADGFGRSRTAGLVDELHNLIGAGE